MPRIVGVGAAASVIIVLVIVSITQHSRLAQTAQVVAASQVKIQSLQEEVAKLKETADHHYQQGIDLQRYGHLEDAKTEFETVIAKFPTSKLVNSAKQRLPQIDAALAKQEAERRAAQLRVEAAQRRAEAERIAEERRRQEQQEQAQRLMGTPIDFGSFYAKAHSTGLPIGKRYKLTAWFCCADMRHFNVSMHEEPSLDGIPDFDDPAQQESRMREIARNPHYGLTCSVVVSIGYDHQIRIHRAENCY